MHFVTKYKTILKLMNYILQLYYNIPVREINNCNRNRKHKNDQTNDFIMLNSLARIFTEIYFRIYGLETSLNRFL